MIEITAFGGFQLTVGGQDLVLNNRKSQALLIYLASHSGRAFERTILAELFWPELPEAAALNNLSKALGQIRKVVNKAGGVMLPIEVTRHTVQLAGDFLDRTSPLWQFDVTLFINLVERARSSTDPAESAAYLERALPLYRGELLGGLTLEDCPTFEGWLLLRRENLMLMAREGYQLLADYYLEKGDYETARDYARQQLALDPWHEEAHRQLMRSLDGMGLRSDALAQYEACREILRSELGVEPEWATRALYEQIKAGQAKTDLPGPPAERRPLPIRLPKQLLPLVGRERELDELRADIADPACRMITIMGAGGVGKTSLALDAAWQVAHDFNDGVYFVPLERLQVSAGIDLQELLAASIGVALEITFSGIEPTHQQLYRYLGKKEMLLLLDNFEHLIAAPGSPSSSTIATFLVTLLEKAPAVKVMLTSRERFGISPEYVLSLEGLPVPDVADDLSTMMDYSSVRLFFEQVRRIQRNFQLTAENGPAVVEICRLVDGLPLGIELAARWVTHFTCAEIAAAIQQNLNFLAAESPQVRERHQSIRATFSYSWQMLTADEQQMLARLSIMLGHFSRDAALTVTQGSLGILVRLQGKSLLHQESPGHYSLHELLRQFIAEKLAGESAGEVKNLRRRYCDYYLQELARQGEGFNQAWTGEAVKEIARHIDNIRRAWLWALEMGYFDPVDRALQALYHYYRIQGLFHEARQLFNHAAAHFRSLLVQAGEDRMVEALLGRSLVRQGRLAWFLADTQQAAHLLQEGLEYLQQAGTQVDLARSYAYLGENALSLGQIDEAGSLLDKALALYRREVDRSVIAFTL